MKRCLSLAVIAALAVPAFASAQARDSSPPPVIAHDALFGVDKPKHLVLSAFIESVSFAGAEVAGASRRNAMTAAVSVTALFDLGRELHDLRKKRLFSFGDLLWDGIGAAAAGLMLRHTYR